MEMEETETNMVVVVVETIQATLFSESVSRRSKQKW